MLRDGIIKIVCWKWKKEGYRSQFTAEHVNTLRDMVRRNLRVAHDFVCITDDPRGIDEDIHIIKLWNNPAPHYGDKDKPNCFYRLRAFSEEMKDLIGERFMWLDLDVVITGDITPLVTDPAKFKIWCVDGERMPCNGSLVLMEAGARADIWKKFNPNDVDPRRGYRQLGGGIVGSDQGWIAQNLRASDEFFSQKDGVYSFRCHLLPDKGRLPPKSKLIFFHGVHHPWDEKLQKQHPWIARYYQRDSKHEKVLNQ